MSGPVNGGRSESQELAHLIGPVLLEDHVDPGEEFAADGAHGDAVRLSALGLALELLQEIRVKAAGNSGTRPVSADLWALTGTVR